MAQATALAASDTDGTVRRVKAAPPMHQIKQPKACCVADDLAATAERLSRLIRANRYNFECSTYVFVDQALNVFAIAESRPISIAWVERHFDWLVGRYDPKPESRSDNVPNLPPTKEGLVEDLTDHLRLMGAEA